MGIQAPRSLSSAGVRSSNIRTEMSVCDARADVVSTFCYDVFLNFFDILFPHSRRILVRGIECCMMMWGRRHRRRHSKWLSASSCNAGVLWLALDQTLGVTMKK